MFDTLKQTHHLLVTDNEQIEKMFSEKIDNIFQNKRRHHMFVLEIYMYVLIKASVIKNRA